MHHIETIKKEAKFLAVTAKNVASNINVVIILNIATILTNELTKYVTIHMNIHNHV